MKITFKVIEESIKVITLDAKDVNTKEEAIEFVESIFDDMISNGEIDLSRPDSYSCDWEFVDMKE